VAVRSFQARLLYLLIAILVLLDAGTLISVYFAGQRTLHNTVAEQLRVGSGVLNRILDARARQLSDSLRVLALDFAFREAVASADVPTITSVLANHGSRIAADAVVLVNLNGVVTADTLGGRLSGKPFPFAAMLQDAQNRGEASATVSFVNRPYQFVIVPVLAPRPIAWVCAGFEIDERVLTDVQRLTTLDISIWSSGAGSHLAPDDSRYATLLQPLATGDGSRVDALLARNLEQARKPFRNLELQIFALSTIVLIVAVFAAVIFARSVSQPLRVLAEGAGRVGRGDYVTP